MHKDFKSLSVYIYRQFHEDFSLIVGMNVLQNCIHSDVCILPHSPVPVL